MSQGPTPRHLVHRLQIVLAALLFSTGGAVVKVDLADQLAGRELPLRNPTLMLVPRPCRSGDASAAPRSMLVGLAYAATMILYVTGNKLTTTPNTIFLSHGSSTCLLLGPLLLHEKVRPRDLLHRRDLIVGMVLLFVGVRASGRDRPDPVHGNIVGAFCGLSWALTISVSRWLGRTMDGPGRSIDAAEAVVAGNLLAS